MKLVIDVFGAPEKSGGMRLYAEELLNAWAARFPEDQLHVVGAPWIAQALAGIPGLEVSTYRTDGPRRIARQWLTTPWVARRIGADAVLSVSSIVSPLSRRPRFCVVHDWRHRKRPTEFSRPQRMYRVLWMWSINSATRAIQISAKTEQETARYAARARRAIVENGQDHARSWPQVAREPGARPTILTFGHHTNKRPDLVLRAAALAAERVAESPRVSILGADGRLAVELADLANSLHVRDLVELPGYVSEQAYQARIQNASVVVLASTDEGFGLPVSEAAYFGVPVVSTNDNGVDAIHGDRARCVDPTPEALADAIVDALREGTRDSRLIGNTWVDTAIGIRSTVLEAIGESRG